jgi:acetyl-CoA carboxylase carboxyltransferase component
MCSATTWQGALEELDALEARARQEPAHSGEAARLSPRERIRTLLDEGSFTELNMLAEHQCRDFGMADKRVPGDGVITGHGTVNGRRVFVYAQDESVFGGSTGKVHGAKIQHVQRLAREAGVPIVALAASAGARIQEGMDNVYGITGVFRQNVINSGVIPQIAAVMGTCAGGTAYSAALSDFVLQVEGSSRLFLIGPAVTRELTGEDVTGDELGGARAHAGKSGVVHLTAADERTCLGQIRQLLDCLPANSSELPPRRDSADPPDRKVPELTAIVPLDPKQPFDMRAVIRLVVDDNDFLELQPSFASNVVIGFARFGGCVTGIVANNPQQLDAYLDLDASDKAARFARTCDAFNIPLVTLVDAPGFWPGSAQEHGGLLRHGAKLLFAWAEATVPKISVVLRRMHGGAIPAMGVHEIGFDQVFAWPSAEMQVLAAEPAVKTLYRRELEAADDPRALLAEKIEAYRNTYTTPYHASALSVVDAVIRPEETRRAITTALAMLGTRALPQRAARKHGNIPL